MTNQWLKSSGLKAEMEEIHNHSPRSKPSYQIIPLNGRIIKDSTNPLYRMYNKYDETIDLTVSGCPELAKTEYIN